MVPSRMRLLVLAAAVALPAGTAAAQPADGFVRSQQDRFRAMPGNSYDRRADGRYGEAYDRGRTDGFRDGRDRYRDDRYRDGRYGDGRYGDGRYEDGRYRRDDRRRNGADLDRAEEDGVRLRPGGDPFGQPFDR